MKREERERRTAGGNSFCCEDQICSKFALYAYNEIDTQLFSKWIGFPPLATWIVIIGISVDGRLSSLTIRCTRRG